MPTWLPWPVTIRQVQIQSVHWVAEEKVLTDLDEQKTEAHFSQAVSQSVQKYLLSTFSVPSSPQSYGHITENKIKQQDLKEPSRNLTQNEKLLSPALVWERKKKVANLCMPQNNKSVKDYN